MEALNYYINYGVKKISFVMKLFNLAKNEDICFIIF